MICLMAEATNLPIGDMTMNVSIHEDNSGALVLAKTLSPQLTPQSKYYTIKTIWFFKEIFKRDIQLNKINTVEQLGDISTKRLTRVVFESIYLYYKRLKCCRRRCRRRRRRHRRRRRCRWCVCTINSTYVAISVRHSTSPSKVA